MINIATASAFARLAPAWRATWSFRAGYAGRVLFFRLGTSKHDGVATIICLALDHRSFHIKLLQNIDYRDCEIKALGSGFLKADYADYLSISV
jgi:hypothetical protein